VELNASRRSDRFRLAAAIMSGIVYAAYLVVCVAPMSPVARSVTASTIRFGVAAAAAVACGLAWSRVVGTDRRPWRYLTGATVSLAIANAIQLYWVAAFGRLATSPSPDDMLLLSAVVFMLLTALALANPTRSRLAHRVGNALDFLAIVGAIFAIGYLAVLRPLELMGPRASMLQNVMMAVYLTLPLAIAVYPFVFREEPWQIWSGLLAIGIAWGAGGYALGGLVVQGRGLYYVGSTAVYLEHSALVAMYLCFILAAVWRIWPPSGGTGPRPAADLPRWPGIVILAVAIPGVPLAIYYSLESRDHFTALIVGLTAAAVASILMARTILLSLSDTQVGAVREEVAHYRALVESAPVSVMVIDDRGIISYANDAAAGALEAASAYDLIGLRADSFLVDPADNSGPDAAVAELIRGFEKTRAPSFVPIERMRLKTLSGALIDVERTAASLMYAGRPAVLVQGIVVTERVRAERESAEYAARLKALAAELVATEERERRQLAEALHDQVSQPLAVARMRLQSFAAGSGATGTDFELALEMIQRAIGETRSLTTELAPAVVYELGVTEALKWLCGEMRRVHGLPCTVTGFVQDEALSVEQRALLFRSTREFLMNVVKHAEAHEAVVRIADSAESVSITVEDDGAGFDATSRPSHSSFGLLSVEQSVSAVGGTLAIESNPPAGTSATVTIPRTQGE